nr:unnamed protein product [Callosobruchus analis]
MITPAIRLVISNICPSVPNSEVEHLLKNNGLKLLSRITYLRVGIPEAEYSHVLSFRRLQLKSASLTAQTLTFEGTTYRIFLSTDSNNCTHCQQPGHPHTRCPNRTSTTEEHISTYAEDQSTSTVQPTDTQETSATQSAEQDIQEAAEDSTPPPAPKPIEQDPHISANPQTKRQLSISPEVIDSNSNTFSQLTSQTKKKKTTGDTEHLLDAASEFIASPGNTLKLNKTELADFIDNAQKSKDIIATSKNYTQDLPELLNIISTLHSLVTDRSLKIRLTKIKKKIIPKT